MNEKGVWRYIRGRRVFIGDGEDLITAMEKSGKFSKYVTDRLRQDAEDGADSSKKREKKLTMLKQEREKLLQKKNKEEKKEGIYEKVKQRHDRLIDKLKESQYSNNVYDLGTLKPIEYNRGYQVTFRQPSDNINNDQYYSMYKEFMEYSIDGKSCAGKFAGQPEVSFNIENMDRALELAEKYNQASIWDWENGEEIRINGRGRRLTK